MATYQTLRDRALNQVGCLGQTEAQTVAEIALYEAMRFVALHIRVPSLIASATATAPANPELEANAITLGASGFNISSTYQAPDRLYIKGSSSVAEIGVPYEYYEYHHFQDLINIPGGERYGLEAKTLEDLHPRSWTITPSNKVWARPIAQNNVLTLVYRVEPAAYNNSNTPEILPMFDYILVNGAVIALKEFLREPVEITTYWSLFENGLKKDIERYDSFLQSQRKRHELKIHRSYRPY